jgi:hypothetical protein
MQLQRSLRQLALRVHLVAAVHSQLRSLKLLQLKIHGLQLLSEVAGLQPVPMINLPSKRDLNNLSNQPFPSELTGHPKKEHHSGRKK